VADRLARFVDVRSGSAEGKDGRDVRAGGILTAFRETRTRRGQVMAFAGLEDLEGRFDLVVFAEPYAQYGGVLRRALGEGSSDGALPVLVSGTLEAGDPPKILVREVLELSRADERLASHLELRLRADEASRDRLAALRQLLESHPGDCQVAVHVVIPGESETVIELPELAVRPGAPLLDDLVGLFGRGVAELRF
jgi:DNA polymerase-3 subunit alpha